MHIRNPSRSDLKYVASIYDEAYDEVKEDPNFGDYLRLKRPKLTNLKDWQDSLYSDIKKDNVKFLVAEDNGKIVGFCFARKKDIPDSEISHVGIVGIRIARGYRGKGLGTQLVGKILKESKGKFEVLEVETMSINKASKALFKRFGFKTWGTAPRYVKRGTRYLDLEYMYLDLK